MTSALRQREVEGYKIRDRYHNLWEMCKTERSRRGGRRTVHVVKGGLKRGCSLVCLRNRETGTP